MVWGALVGVGLAVVVAMQWRHPLYSSKAGDVLWPYPDIMGLSPREILLAELKWGLAITAFGALIGLFTGAPQAFVDLGQDLRARGRRALAAIRYVTRPRITFLD